MGGAPVPTQPPRSQQRTCRALRGPVGKPSLPTRRETWCRDHRCHPSLALPVPRGLEQVEQVQAGLPGWLQVPRALLTWSNSFSHPFPSSSPAFIPFLKPPYVFCTEQSGLAWPLTPQRRQGSSGSNILLTALLPRPTRAPLCPTPPASGPALWTPSFSCLSPFSSGVHGPWRFKERTVC